MYGLINPSRRGRSVHIYRPPMAGPSNAYVSSTGQAVTTIVPQMTFPTLTATADATESIAFASASLLADVAQATSTIISNANQSVLLASSGVGYEALVAGFSIALAVSADATEALTLANAVALADELAASESIASTLACSEALAVALTATDLAVSGFTHLLTDTANAVETVASLYSANLALVSTGTATETVTNVLGVAISLTDTAAVSESLSANATLVEALSSGAQGVVSLSLGSTDYVGLLTNTDTTALSSYSNFPFNSMAVLGDNVYAASDTGIYQLTGNTDDSTEIQAKIKTGLNDFGTDMLKRFESAAVGYTSDGELVLKTSTSQAGAAKEKWYKLKAQTADYAREGVIKIAKGTKARYWQLEIENIDGADFDLSTLRLYPIMLTRRR